MNKQILAIFLLFALAAGVVSCTSSRKAGCKVNSGYSGY